MTFYMYTLIDVCVCMVWLASWLIGWLILQHVIIFLGIQYQNQLIIYNK